MTPTVRVFLCAVATLAFLVPVSAHAQRRPRAQCSASCTESGARLGFLFQSEWNQSDDNMWHETITVDEILADSPADGQLRRGDVILRVNGLVATSQLFWSVRRTLAAGDTVRLRIRRGDAERDVTLTAAERP